MTAMANRTFKLVRAAELNLGSRSSRGVWEVAGQPFLIARPPNKRDQRNASWRIRPYPLMWDAEASNHTREWLSHTGLE